MQEDGQMETEVEVEIQATAAPSAETEEATNKIPSQEEQGDTTSQGNLDDEQCNEEVKVAVEEPDNENQEKTAADEEDDIENKESPCQEEVDCKQNPKEIKVSLEKPDNENAKPPESSEATLIEDENQVSDNNDKHENGNEPSEELLESSKLEAELVQDDEKESDNREISVTETDKDNNEDTEALHLDQEECEKPSSEQEIAGEKEDKSEKVESTQAPNSEGDIDGPEIATETEITENDEIKGIDHDLGDGEHHKKLDLHEATEQANDAIGEETSNSEQALIVEAEQDEVKEEQTLEFVTQEGGCQPAETAQELDTDSNHEHITARKEISSQEELKGDYDQFNKELQVDDQVGADNDIKNQETAAESAEDEKAAEEIPSQEEHGDMKSQGDPDDEQCPEVVKETFEEPDNDNQEEVVVQTEDVIGKPSESIKTDDDKKESDNNDKQENGVETPSEDQKDSQQEGELVQEDGDKNETELTVESSVAGTENDNTAETQAPNNEEKEPEKDAATQDITEGNNVCDEEKKSDEVESTEDTKPEDSDGIDNATEPKGLEMPRKSLDQIEDSEVEEIAGMMEDI